MVSQVTQPDSSSESSSSSVPPSEPVPLAIVQALREFAVELIQADGGDVWLVSATNERVHIHLSGSCAGCPGSTMTRDRLLAPIVERAAPAAAFTLTTGWRVPSDATKVT